MLLDKINLNNKKHIVLIILITVLLLRAHTFFNDYYDRDELAQMVYAVHAVETSNLFFGPYGNSVNFVFNFSAKIFGNYNWQILHLIAFLFVLFTGFMIYLSVININGNELAGLYSAFFYTIFVSIGYKDFYNLSAEIIFNTYISISFYFLTYALFRSKNLLIKVINIGFSIVFAYLVYNAKMHSKFYLLIYLFLLPLFIKNRKKRIMAIIFIISAIILLMAIVLISNSSVLNSIKIQITSALDYIYAGNLNFSYLLFRIITVIILFTFAQFWLWYYSIKFIKIKLYTEYDIKHSIVILFFIISFIPAIVTLRFYPHYFIQPILPASIMAGIFLFMILSKNDEKAMKTKRKILSYIFILTSLAFVISFSLVIAKAINPDRGSKLQMFWPDSKLVPVIKWFKQNEIRNQKIFIWGDAPEITYFTKNNSGPFPLWYSIFAKSYFKKPDENIDRNMIKSIEKENVVYFIDTQPSDFSGFGKYPVNKLKILYDYIQNNFKKVIELNNIIIYKNKNYPNN